MFIARPLIALLIAAAPAHAKLFRNAYASFELPPNWNCKLEGSEWVCENDFSAKTKEAIIILTAKEVGPGDTMAQYLAHLQIPHSLPGRGNQVLKSQLINIKERMISNYLWIDALHLGSEVGPYFTRYLATIKDRIAILVTFSAHKEHYTKYSGDFIKAIESLKVVATKDTMPGRPGSLGGMAGGATDSGTLGGAPGGNGAGGDLSLPNEALPSKPGGQNASKLLGFAVICLAIGVYLFTRKGKGKKSKSRGSSRSRKK
jgi:hypothetical protein